MLRIYPILVRRHLYIESGPWPLKEPEHQQHDIDYVELEKVRSPNVKG